MSDITTSRSRFSLVVLGTIILLGLWLRLPFITTGIPYFYDEDEAHHFNRVVNMVKQGEYNPHYFHKPSLHFYLRMPVVAASFLAAVKAGQIRTLDELITRDVNGVGDYAFSVSHPKVLEWTRALSVLLSLGIVVLVWAIAFECGAPLLVQSGAALLAAVSPELVQYSAVVGVDTLMTFMACLTVFLSLRASASADNRSWWWAALCAGLAVSSKYNALPIVVVPALAWLLSQRHTGAGFVAVLIGPAVGFLLGTPYSLQELPLFLNQFAYEIWHYRIAGHEGHSAEPGLAQVVHYGRWLLHDGLGLGGVVCAAIGAVAALWMYGRKAAIVCVFPVLFFALMCLQRTNFTRNMIAVLPFAALAAWFGVQLIVQQLPKTGPWRRAVVALLFLFVLVLPLRLTIARDVAATTIAESRVDLTDWLTTKPLRGDVAVASDLQVSPKLCQTLGLVRMLPQVIHGSGLYQQGFDFVIAGSSVVEGADPWLHLERQFSGAVAAQRVVQNPQIYVYRIRPPAPESAPAPFELSCTIGSSEYLCAQDPAEGHAWLMGRRAIVRLPLPAKDGPDAAPITRVSFSLMTPWSDQQVSVRLVAENAPGIRIEGFTPGVWREVTLDLPAGTLEASGGAMSLEIMSQIVHAPAAKGLGNDSRRLALAIKKVSLVRSGS